MAKKRKGGAHKGAHDARAGAVGSAAGGSAPPGSFSRSFADSLPEPEPEPVVLPRAPERLSSPFKDALGSLKKQLQERDKQQKLDKLEPPAMTAVKPVARKKVELPEHEAIALSLAMQGVKPLGGGRPGRVGTTTKRVESRTSMVAPFGRGAEEEARSRLDALVAQDVSFRIERDQDWVRAARTDAPPRVVRELARRQRASETLDLHGMNQRQARDAVISFLRSSHKRGLTVLCLVHGKGQHSEDGVGVLRDVAISAITDSGAAQLVYAFCSAPEALGGSGALLVELKH